MTRSPLCTQVGMAEENEPVSAGGTFCGNLCAIFCVPVAIASLVLVDLPWLVLVAFFQGLCGIHKDGEAASDAAAHMV